MDVAQQSKRRVLIRTLMRTTTPEHLNYGGLLQAWALQQAVRGLGYECATDESRPDVPIRPRSRLLARTVVKAAPPALVPMKFARNQLEAELNERLLRFGLQNLERVRVFGRDGRLDEDALDDFDAWVVGSDQVWRSDYGDVLSYLLDFLPKSFAGPRVAYAASFGSAEPSEESAALSRSAGEAARRLTAVSVREDSGIDVTRELWGVKAERVLDPTLLLYPHDYSERLSIETPEAARGAVVSYVLDPDQRKRAFTEDLANGLGLESYQMLPPPPRSYAAFVADRERYLRPSVEAWIGAIANADCVLTDSFHGCAFAILFSRPFLVVPNHQRGLARFESLLQLVGLTDRFIGEGDVSRQMRRPIDWGQVRASLEADRLRSMEFLGSALNSPSRL
ncbi:hypothetical protein GL325_10920 [Aeromicrobium sp. 636]|uniref:Polysaccharide pyruvyl transferase family protein n=1 Tax=Aeromicrobium senzhongii TaxID=2663859 RepID=A0A8I0K358_9ACTN|nr:polysaccharide pyruvyl transferase family protein [Aeromicrobium senzhongii]MCQ3998940.1 hypothetical protein [Aeromicrobium sp. 636]